MSARSCVDCGAPLGAGDEVCPLGHHSEDKLQSDLAVLRAAVDAAFAAAQSEVQLLTSSMINSPETSPAPPDPVASGPTVTARPVAFSQPTLSSIQVTVAELSAGMDRSTAKPPAPDPAASVSPPPVPDPAASVSPPPVPDPAGSGSSAPSAPPPPPPPPPAALGPSAVRPLFVPRPAAEDRPDDPIAAFAPAPRLDWGPDRAKGDALRKRFNR